MVLKNLLDLLKTPIHSYSLPDLSNLSIRPRNVSKANEKKESKEVNHQSAALEIKEALWNAESTYQDSSDIHAALDLKDLSVFTANESLKNILGYSLEEWEKIVKSGSQGVLSLIHENDRELVTKNFTALQLGIPCFAVARIRHQDSHKGYICLGGYASVNVALGMMYVSAKDLTPYLTDTRHLIHDARNAAQLVQASFMEIREVLESQTKVAQAKQKEIISLAEQAKVCIWNFLRVLQRQTIVEFLTIKPVAANLTECISRIVNLFRIEIEKKGLTREMSLPQDEFYIFDRLQFEGVLVNLMTNAVKYTLTGKITVSLNIENGQNAPEDKLKVVVSDTGIGISTEDMSHIFESHYRTQKAKACNTGTGIGLSLVKQIVEKMGGIVSLESKEGHGTVVTLAFSAQKTIAADAKKQQLLDILKMDLDNSSPPDSQRGTTPQNSARQPASTANQEEKKSSEDELKGLKILIVDDSEINTKIYEKMLVKLGCMCTRVLSGHQAIEKLISNTSTNSPSFDIIFMDICMPELDGLETTRCIKTAKLAEQSIVIGISGNVDQEAEQKALEAGMVAYITKPATAKKIEETMRKNLPALYQVKFKKQISRPHTPRALSVDFTSAGFSTVGLFSTTSATCSYLSSSSLFSYSSPSSSSSSVSPTALQRKLLLLAVDSSSSSSSSSSGSEATPSGKLQKVLAPSPATRTCSDNRTVPAS